MGLHRSSTARSMGPRRNQRSFFAIGRRSAHADSKLGTAIQWVQALTGGCVDIVKGNMGWIEVVVGPMFSGKSEELIRRLRRAEIAKQRVQIFKPVIDQRYAKNGIVSHSGL